MNNLDMDEILYNIEALEAAENRKSIQEILELVTEDFLFVYCDSTVSGKAGLGEMLKESLKNFVSSKHVPLRIEVSTASDMAWLFGYELNQRARDTEVVETKQFYLITFRKEEGKWKQVTVCLA